MIRNWAIPTTASSRNGIRRLPEDWVCPLCQEGKEVFEPID